MNKFQVLSVICSFLQILGLILIVSDMWRSLPALIGVCGFAAVVGYYVQPDTGKSWRKRLSQVAAICGVGMILMACFAG